MTEQRHYDIVFQVDTPLELILGITQQERPDRA